MKAVSELIADWEALKEHQPKDWALPHTLKIRYWSDQTIILQELDDAGCIQIPGETLPVREMTLERREFISQWA